MKDALFDELRASMHEAHARGKRELRTTVLPAVPEPMGAAEVRALRERVNASQAVFARYLNVSTRLVQAWEADRRHPEGAALRLLELGARDPATVFAGLLSTTRRRAARRLREDAPRVALSEAELD
jgi:putative transcriptional regulator